MQVTHAGYKDPNNLTFKNITILGVSYPPNSSAVSSISREGSPTISLPHTMQYDAEKKVLKCQKNTHPDGTNVSVQDNLKQKSQ